MRRRTRTSPLTKQQTARAPTTCWGRVDALAGNIDYSLLIISAVTRPSPTHSLVALVSARTKIVAYIP
ncbi:hypothetical protein GCM10009677_29440 [Sphaerisporangium rubeum]